MSNQAKLNQYIQIDQKVFHRLLFIRENFDRISSGLSFFVKNQYSLELDTMIKLYKARQAAIKQKSKVKKSGYKRLYAWLVQKWASGDGHAIGAIPFIPIAIIAATALSGTAVATTYLTNRQQAEAQLKQTDKLLKAMAESDPEVAKAIAQRLNQSSTSSGGNTITNVVYGILGIVALSAASKLISND